MEAVTATGHTPSITKPRLSRDMLAAIITGQIAGLIMAVVVMLVFTIFLGKGPLYPVQVIGSVVFGDSALVGFHLPAFITGLILHQGGPALLWAIAFGLLLRSFEIRDGLGVIAIGALVGLLSQLVDVLLVLPPVMKALHGHDIWAEQVPAFWSWAAHLVYGLGLALFPWVSRHARR
jgi:hypothetical protein